MGKDKKSTEQIRLSGSIALSKLQHVTEKRKGKKGKKVECLIIPLKNNYLVKDKDTGAIYMEVNVIYKPDGDDYDRNGFISQSVSSKLWKAADEEEQQKMKNTPILGSIKDWGSGNNKSDDDSGSHGEIDEDDDLPF